MSTIVGGSRLAIRRQNQGVSGGYKVYISLKRQANA